MVVEKYVLWPPEIVRLVVMEQFVYATGHYGNMLCTCWRPSTCNARLVKFVFETMMSLHNVRLVPETKAQRKVPGACF